MLLTARGGLLPVLTTVIHTCANYRSRTLWLAIPAARATRTGTRTHGLTVSFFVLRNMKRQSHSPKPATINSETCLKRLARGRIPQVDSFESPGRHGRRRGQANSRSRHSPRGGLRRERRMAPRRRLAPTSNGAGPHLHGSPASGTSMTRFIAGQD